ncbi:MAG TPA: hypothetical protein VK070_02330, partial [Acidimicrobiia bacterium]|nr:hypothetical protein [Acidimicrobiia bacterium]
MLAPAGRFVHRAVGDGVAEERARAFGLHHGKGVARVGDVGGALRRALADHRVLGQRELIGVVADEFQ